MRESERNIEREANPLFERFYAGLVAGEREAHEMGPEYFEERDRRTTFAREGRDLSLGKARWQILRYSKDIVPGIQTPQFQIDVTRSGSEEESNSFLLGDDFDGLVERYRFVVSFHPVEGYRFETHPPSLREDAKTNSELTRKPVLANAFLERLMSSEITRATEIENMFADTSPVPLLEGVESSPTLEFEHNRSQLSEIFPEASVSRLELPASYQVESGFKVVSDAKIPMPSGKEEYKQARYIVILKEITATGGWAKGPVGSGKYKVKEVRLGDDCEVKEVLVALRKSRHTIQGLPRTEGE